MKLLGQRPLTTDAIQISHQRFMVAQYQYFTCLGVTFSQTTEQKLIRLRVIRPDRRRDRRFQEAQGHIGRLARHYSNADSQ
jgi:hypothetical protein